MSDGRLEWVTDNSCRVQPTGVEIINKAEAADPKVTAPSRPAPSSTELQIRIMFCAFVSLPVLYGHIFVVTLPSHIFYW